MKRNLSFMIMLMVTLVMSLFYVRARFLLVELSYDVSHVEKQNRELEQQRDLLAIELAVLKNPKRIEKIARNTLGLRHGPNSLKIKIPESGKYEFR